MLYLPGNLKECNADQYVEMCELIYRYQMGQITYEDLRVMAVYKLLDLKPSGKELLIPDRDNMLSNIYQISERIDNFFEVVNGQKVIKQDYTNNPVPAFKPLWVKYYGPADAFRNVTFGEYTDGLRLFMEFSTTGNIELLYLLAAIFYRKKKSFHWLRKLSPKYDADIRVPYNSNLIEARAKDFKYMPVGFIYGFFLYFASFQKFLTGAVVPWGGQMLDFSILFDAGPSDRLEAVPGMGMDGLSFALAESGQLGDLEGVRKTNLWVVLGLMYNIRKQDLDFKINEKREKK